MNKKNSIIFSVALFFMIAGFVAIIAWAEFSGPNEDIEKKLSENSAISTNPMNGSSSSMAAAKSANTPGAVAGESAQSPSTSGMNSPYPSSQNSAMSPSDPTANPSPDASTSTDGTPTDSSQSSTPTKNYQNNTLGISFDYPEDYSIELKNGNQVVATKDGVVWKLKVYDNKDKEEIKTWFDDHFPTKDNVDCVLGDAATLKIGSFTIKTLKADSSDKKCEDGGFFAQNDNKTKVVKVVLDKGTEDEANKILSTFKFL